MPLVLEVCTAGRVPAGVLQPPIDLGQPGELLGQKVRGQLERQGLEGAGDLTDISDLAGIEERDSKPFSHVRFEHAFSGQSNEGLADRRTADAEAGGNGGVTKTESWCGVAPVDTIEDSAVDLVAERRTFDHLHTEWDILNTEY